MPNIKMINSPYSDDTAIYDVVNYCFDHNLADYVSTYLPIPGDLERVPADDRRVYLQGAIDFWNYILNMNLCNTGKRLLHFSIGLTYMNNKRSYMDMLASDVLECLYMYAYEKRFPSVAVEHITPEGYCHIHFVIGTVNLSGEKYNTQNVNPYNIAKCIADKVGEQVQVQYDDVMDNKR